MNVVRRDASDVDAVTESQKAWIHVAKALRPVAYHHEQNPRLVTVRWNVSGCFRALGGEEVAEQDTVKKRNHGCVC